MEVLTLLLQVITILISLLSLFITIVQQRNENKKGHFLEIVTKERIKELRIIRTNSAEFLTLTNPYALKEMSEADVQNAISQSILKIENIKSIFKDIYAEEKEIREKGIEIVEKLCQYITCKERKLLDELIILREDFAHRMSVYDHAYWEFIVHQSDGNYAGNDRFMKYYYKSVEEFKNIK